MAQSRHPEMSPVCPLSGVKRTLSNEALLSAYDPMYGPAVRCKRTFIELADVRSCINVSGL